MEDEIRELCNTIRETSFAIHGYLRHGHQEKVYENALANRLRKLSLDIKQQYPLQVSDEDGTLLGSYYADLYVDNKLVVELKACNILTWRACGPAVGVSSSHPD